MSINSIWHKIICKYCYAIKNSQKQLKLCVNKTINIRLQLRKPSNCEQTYEFKNWSSSSSSSSSCRAASSDIPDPSLDTSPYRSSPLVGLQGHIPYPHIAAECMFEPVVPPLPGHMWGSIGVQFLYELVPASPAVTCMSGSSSLDSFRDGW